MMQGKYAHDLFSMGIEEGLWVIVAGIDAGCEKISVFRISLKLPITRSIIFRR